MKTSMYTCSRCEGFFEATGNSRNHVRYATKRGRGQLCPECTGIVNPERVMVAARMTPAETVKAFMGFAQLLARLDKETP